MGEATTRSPSRYQYPGSSRGEKRTKESENYWTARRYEERSPREKDLLKRDEKAPEARISHGVNRSSSIWNRLEEKNHKDAPRDRGASNRSGPYSSAVGSYKRPEINRAKNHREDKGAARSYNRSSPPPLPDDLETPYPL